MKYIEVIRSANAEKVFKALEIEYTQSGAYLHFPCACGKAAFLKSYGRRKNLWFCKHCKKGGHIISLVMNKKSLTWEEAKGFLNDYMVSNKKILHPLTFLYDLAYSDILEDLALTKEICDQLGIGKPKGKTMMAGCIAFEIYEGDNLIAYFGIRIKDGRSVYHKSFNPELYLYGKAKEGDEVVLTRNMYRYAWLNAKERPAVCNFSLDYLSNTQLGELKKFKKITLDNGNNVNNREIISQLTEAKIPFEVV